LKRTLLIGAILVFGTCLHAVAEPDSLTSERFTIHGQTTIINQYKPSFSAPYTGSNSLRPDEESRTSITSTLFLGARLWKGGSIYLNPELAGGAGLSSVLGLGDATNGETFRIGDPSPTIYLARLFIRQVFALTDDKLPRKIQFFHNHSDFNQLAQEEPVKYFAITAGKIGIADYFDDNTYSHDPRTQFMNWALMANGAWDYPANTRGYAPSVVFELVTPKNQWRYAVSLMPMSANGLEMNWALAKSNSHSFEYTRFLKVNGKDGALRLLGYFTTTQMGSYKQSLEESAVNPVIENTRQYGRTKYGFGINYEQKLSNDLGCFFRSSWNDGNNEIWAFTQIDNSISGGVLLTGNKWKRPNDNVGLAFVSSGISKPHQDYLKAGGTDFMIGDGKLNYAREFVTECYYSTEMVNDHTYLSVGYQLLLNPGYNKDRQGPAHVFSVRLHTRI
jgi:high affinity Mn2+ porin